MADKVSSEQPDEALLDMLIEEVTAGLSPEDARVLKELQDNATGTHLREFERVTAAVDVAFSAGDRATIPATLRARIEDDARAFLRDHDVSPLSPRRVGSPLSPPPAKRAGWTAWLIAAACLVIALLGWLRPIKPASPPVVVTMPAVPPIAAPAVRSPPPVAIPPPTPSEQRTALLAHPGVITLTLGATKDPAASGVAADVVWDPATQQGFVRIAGLKPNDPANQQYQAWIFDAARDKRYPLTAGLFNVPADSTEVIVPIHAALPVHGAKAFAVTLEAAGGAVVPSLHHVIVLGAVS